MVLALVVTEELHFKQLNVKIAFLHGYLEEEIYMMQPQGFIVQGKERMVCKLQKSLYGPNRLQDNGTRSLTVLWSGRCEQHLVLQPSVRARNGKRDRERWAIGERETEI